MEYLMDGKYLFKAKRLEDGNWKIGYLVKNQEWAYIVKPLENGGVEFETVDPNTICQCTGLKDRNGKLIWENDIVNCADAECYGYISWNESEAGFYFNVLLEGGGFNEEHIYDYQDCMEVIGNIFDNEELLESEG